VDLQDQIDLLKRLFEVARIQQALNLFKRGLITACIGIRHGQSLAVG
jgi:hypothetical protein